eukprot:gene4375-4628_t
MLGLLQGVSSDEHVSNIVSNNFGDSVAGSSWDGPQVQVWGSTAYVPQAPFILGGTIRDNVIFGRPFEQQRYRAAVSAAQLEADFVALPGGDMTELGFTTTGLASTRVENCSVCAVGYGGSNCTACPPGTFNPQSGTTAPCRSCNCTAKPCQLSGCNSRSGSCSYVPDLSKVGSDCGTPGFPMKCYENGQCGYLCTPLNCSSPFYAGGCGVNLTNGCPGQVINCSCPNPWDSCDAPNGPGRLGTCSCKPKKCPWEAPPAMFNSSAYCGRDLDDGCGGRMDCPCTGDREICSTWELANEIGYCQCPKPRTCDDYKPLCGGGLSTGCRGRRPLECSNCTWRPLKPLPTDVLQAVTVSLDKHPIGRQAAPEALEAP